MANAALSAEDPVDPPADPATDPAPADHETAPELSPCPHFGHTDLNDSGEQITCNVCSCVGPVPGSGMDKYGAWNARAAESAEDESAEDPAPEDAPPTDPAAHANGVGSLGAAKKLIITDAQKAQRVHAGFKQAVAEAKKARAEAATLAASIAEAQTAKATAEAALAKEQKAHADYKAGEPKRINSAIAYTAAAQGIPPVKTAVNTEGNANPGKVAKPEVKGLGKVEAAFREQLANQKN